MKLLLVKDVLRLFRFLKNKEADDNSGRYKTQEQLAKKLGYTPRRQVIQNILQTKKQTIHYLVLEWQYDWPGKKREIG